MSDRLRTRAALAAVAAVCLATLALAGTDVFWVGDEAVKLLQVRALLERGWTDPAIAWAGAAIDPTLEASPLPPPFALARDGRLHAQYSPFFALASALPFRLLGAPGLYLLPFVGTLALLAGVARLARRLDPDARTGALAVLIAGFATPIWFYAATFWEHAPAGALAVWAVVIHLEDLRRPSPRTLALSSALAAAAAWFREEQILLALLLALIAVARSRRRAQDALRIAAVTAAVLAPLALLLWRTTGSPFGLHAAANLGGLGEHLSSRATVFRNLWLAAGSGPPPAWVFTLPAVALLFVAPVVRRERYGPALAATGLAGCAIAAASLAGLSRAANPIVWLLGNNSLFPAAPALVLGLVRPRSDDNGREWRLVQWIAAGYGAAYTLAAPEISSGGLHWGNRFLYPLYAWLAVLAAAALARAGRGTAGTRRWLAPAAAALALGVAIQLVGFRLLDQKKGFSRRLAHAVAARPEPAIVTDQWWVGAELHALLAERPVFFVRSPAQLAGLRERLAGSGATELLVVRRAPRDPAPGLVVIDDGPLDYFAVTIERYPSR